MNVLLLIGGGLVGLLLLFFLFVWLPVMGEAREEAEFEARETGLLS